MNAAISGRAGRALLLEGDSVSTFDLVGAYTVPSTAADFALLLNELTDVVFLENVTIEQVQAELRIAAECQKALDLALISLDPQLKWEIRQRAIIELEWSLRRSDIGKYLRDVLFARPLPKAGDLEGAFGGCVASNSKFSWDLFRDIELAQPDVKRFGAMEESGANAERGGSEPLGMDSNYLPLFDGTTRTFKLWESVGRGKFVLIDRQIVAIPKGDLGLLFYTQPFYGNIRLQLEVYLDREDDISAIFLFLGDPRKPTPTLTNPNVWVPYINEAWVPVSTGIEIPIGAEASSRQSEFRTGAMYSFAKQDSASAPMWRRGWNTCKIEATGHEIVSYVNECKDASRLAHSRLYSGFIGLQACRGFVGFRNIQVNQL
jgi:hypothetical protein